MREAERAFDVLSELVVRPLLRDEDIARERDIIVEEIRSYRDDPGQYVFNLFDRAFFGDTPLGWEIAGDEDSVRGLPETDIRDFWSDDLPARQRGHLGRRRPRPRHASSTWSSRNFGTGNGVVPGFERGADASRASG